MRCGCKLTSSLHGYFHTFHLCLAHGRMLREAAVITGDETPEAYFARVTLRETAERLALWDTVVEVEE